MDSLLFFKLIKQNIYISSILLSGNIKVPPSEMGELTYLFKTCIELKDFQFTNEHVFNMVHITKVDGGIYMVFMTRRSDYFDNSLNYFGIPYREQNVNRVLFGQREIAKRKNFWYPNYDIPLSITVEKNSLVGYQISIHKSKYSVKPK